MTQKCFLSGAVLVCLSLSVPAMAREAIPFIGIQIEENSNVKRVSDNEVSDTKIAPFVGIEFEDFTGSYNASVDARLDYETYADNVFKDRSLIEAEAYFDWIVQPGRFTWAVGDYASQFRVDIQKPDTPNNTQTVNVFAIGPDVLLSRGAGDLLLKARYADVSYSKGAEDSQRLIGAASLKRNINSYSTLNLDSTLSVVNYKSEFGDDYDVLTTGLRYNRELPYGELFGAVGYNGFDFDRGRSKNDPYFDFGATLNIGGSSRLDFSAAHKLTDLALESFNPLYTRLLDELELNTLFKQTTERGASGVYRVTRAFSGYTYRGPRFSWSLNGYLNEQRYFDINTNNLDETGVSVSLAYVLTEKVRIAAGTSKADVDYVVTGLEVDWTTHQLGLSYNFAENFYLNTGVTIEDSVSDLEIRDFQNDRVYLTLEYKAEPKLEN